MIHLLILSLINCIIVAAVVMVHYEALFYLSRWLPTSRVKPRYRIVVGLAGALAAHCAEIWIFALCYYAMVIGLGWGSFGGAFEGTLLDCFYFSFTSYTTLGFGDIQPFGEVRYLTGIESLTGLVLITWTASFLYLEMQEYWVED